MPVKNAGKLEKRKCPANLSPFLESPAISGVLTVRHGLARLLAKAFGAAPPVTLQTQG
jgi:hypothetical protein